MMRRIVAVLSLGLTLATTGAVFALSYDGESYCRDHPAWPNGSYLGQMHRQHIDHYIKHFGEDGSLRTLGSGSASVGGAWVAASGISGGAN